MKPPLVSGLLRIPQGAAFNSGESTELVSFPLARRKSVSWNILLAYFHPDSEKIPREFVERLRSSRNSPAILIIWPGTDLPCSGPLDLRFWI